MGVETGGEGLVVNEFIVEYGMKVRVASEQRSKDNDVNYVGHTEGMDTHPIRSQARRKVYANP